MDLGGGAWFEKNFYDLLKENITPGAYTAAQVEDAIKSSSWYGRISPKGGPNPYGAMGEVLTRLGQDIKLNYSPPAITGKDAMPYYFSGYTPMPEGVKYYGIPLTEDGMTYEDRNFFDAAGNRAVHKNAEYNEDTGELISPGGWEIQPGTGARDETLGKYKAAKQSEYVANQSGYWQNQSDARSDEGIARANDKNNGFLGLGDLGTVLAIAAIVYTGGAAAGAWGAGATAGATAGAAAGVAESVAVAESLIAAEGLGAAEAFIAANEATVLGGLEAGIADISRTIIQTAVDAGIPYSAATSTPSMLINAGIGALRNPDNPLEGALTGAATSIAGSVIAPAISELLPTDFSDMTRDVVSKTATDAALQVARTGDINAEGLAIGALNPYLSSGLKDVLPNNLIPTAVRAIDQLIVNGDINAENMALGAGGAYLGNALKEAGVPEEFIGTAVGATKQLIATGNIDPLSLAISAGTGAINRELNTDKPTAAVDSPVETVATNPVLNTEVPVVAIDDGAVKAETINNFDDLVPPAPTTETIETVDDPIGELSAVPEALPPISGLGTQVETQTEQEPPSEDPLAASLTPTELTPVGGLNATAAPKANLVPSGGLKSSSIIKPIVATAGNLLKTALTKKPAPKPAQIRAPRPVGGLKMAAPPKMDVSKLIPIQRATAPQKTLQSSAGLSPITNIAGLTALLGKKV